MEIKERMRLTRWAADMAECQNSGLTQAQWCELRGISLKTFEHRCKRVRDKVSESIGETDPSLPPPAFAELPADVMKNAQDSSLGMPTMVIKFENATVELNNGVLPAHLKMVLEVLTRAE